MARSSIHRIVVQLRAKYQKDSKVTQPEIGFLIYGIKSLLVQVLLSDDKRKNVFTKHRTARPDMVNDDTPANEREDLMNTYFPPSERSELRGSLEKVMQDVLTNQATEILEPHLDEVKEEEYGLIQSSLKIEVIEINRGTGAQS